MRRRLAVGAGALAGILLVTAPARAQFFDWRTSLGVSGSYGRSFTDTPSPVAQVYAGPSIGVSASLAGILETPRTASTLTYGFSTGFPLDGRLTSGQVPFTYAN